MADATHPPREVRENGRARPGALSEGRRAAGPPNNLPSELSSFVGRERELAEVKRLLEDRVWLVELAPLANPSLVQGAVASVVAAREQPGRALIETLSEHLGSKKV